MVRVKQCAFAIINLLILCHKNCLYPCECHDSDLQDYLSDGHHYINDWAIKIVGGSEVAKRVARELEYEYLGEIPGFQDIYLMKKLNHPRRTKRHAVHLTNKLNNDDRVVWAEQQIAKLRVKRGYIRPLRPHINQVNQRYWSNRDSNDRGHKQPLPSEDNRFNDELWKFQWYMHDTRNMPNLPRLDLCVKQVWDKGYTGKGIVICVMDDGLEWNHTDIYPNYDPEASCDTNDNDRDPYPRYDRDNSNSHGTRCAGEIAMVGQNGKCGVGIAFNAKIGGIRCLDGDVSDMVEAISISFKTDHIHVYSSSWGPNDDGMTVDGPKRLALEALTKGVTEGRNGKGCIYVWASGNGGMKGDNCNCDGYASSIYTLSIGSASQTGQFPWYGERCSSTMAVTYSSGAYHDQKIATIDLHNKCTIDHSGTSAAAPLAAGIIALALEANPELTWRDVQHIVVCTSDFMPLMENKGWKRNAAGLLYNSKCGFGIMNAETIVDLALKWKTVPPSIVLVIECSSNLPINLVSGSEIRIIFNVHASDIKSLEHVQVNINMDYTRRGNIDIYLESPSGSVTMLLSRRPKDSSVLGFRNWNLTSCHLWGENPEGKWTLMIRDKRGTGHKGMLKNAFLILHGTQFAPGCLADGPKKYKNEDLVYRTLDPMPEYLQSDIYDQNNMENQVNKVYSPSHSRLASDFIGIPWSRTINWKGNFGWKK